MQVPDSIGSEDNLCISGLTVQCQQHKVARLFKVVQDLAVKRLDHFRLAAAARLVVGRLGVLGLSYPIHLDHVGLAIRLLSALFLRLQRFGREGCNAIQKVLTYKKIVLKNNLLVVLYIQLVCLKYDPCLLV